MPDHFRKMDDLNISMDVLERLVQAGHAINLESEVALVVSTLSRSDTHPIACLRPDYWRYVAASLSFEDFAALLRVLVIDERTFGGGSVAPAIWAFRSFKARYPQHAVELADWCLAHTQNEWVPFGSRNHGARSVAEFEEAQEMLAHGKAQTAVFERALQEAARLRRADRASLNLVGAIRRGDVSAIRALLGQGANPHVPNSYGITAFELAKQLERVDLLMITRTSP